MMKMIVVFFPAFICISVYAKRRSVELMPDLKLLIRYGIYVMIINWCSMSTVTYVFAVKDCRLEYMDSWGFLTKYNFIAMFFAWIIPYIEEVVRKSISISFKVESREDKSNENH